MGKLKPVSDDRRIEITSRWHKLSDVAPTEGQKVRFAYCADLSSVESVGVAICTHMEGWCFVDWDGESKVEPFLPMARPTNTFWQPC